MLNTKRLRKVAVLLGSVTCLVFLAAFLGRLDGEAFLVTEEGRAEAAPGAAVRLYRKTDNTSLAGFVQRTLDLHVEYRKRGSELTDKVIAIMRAVASRKIPLENANQAMRLLRRRQEQDAESFCRETANEAFKYYGVPTLETKADRNGRFRARVFPGKYILWVSGQAGAEHAEWMREVVVLWPTHERLVEPECKWSTRADD